GAIAALDRRLDPAFCDAGCERDRILHLLHEVGELTVVVRARLGDERAPFRDDVRGRAAADLADVRGRLLVDPAEPHLGDRAGGSGDRGPTFLRIHASVRGAAVEGDVQLLRGGSTEDHLADRGGLVVDITGAGAQARVVE